MAIERFRAEASASRGGSSCAIAELPVIGARRRRTNSRERARQYRQRHDRQPRPQSAGNKLLTLRRTRRPLAAAVVLCSRQSHAYLPACCRSWPRGRFPQNWRVLTFIRQQKRSGDSRESTFSA